MFTLTLLAGVAWLIFVMTILRLLAYRYSHTSIGKALAFAIG